MQQLTASNGSLLLLSAAGVHDMLASSALQSQLESGALHGGHTLTHPQAQKTNLSPSLKRPGPAKLLLAILTTRLVFLLLTIFITGNTFLFFLVLFLLLLTIVKLRKTNSV